VDHWVGNGDLNWIEGKRTHVFELYRAAIHSDDVGKRHFGAALAKPSPSSNEFEARAADHDESMSLVQELGDRGSRATVSMRPRWHWGHCRNEVPVRSS
jgi:hypothetical protein